MVSRVKMLEVSGNVTFVGDPASGIVAIKVLDTDDVQYFVCKVLDSAITVTEAAELFVREAKLEYAEDLAQPEEQEKMKKQIERFFLHLGV